MSTRIHTTIVLLCTLLFGCDALPPNEDGPNGLSGLAVVGPDCGDPGVAAMIGSTDYATIQDAIDAALTSETVEICPGTHTEQLSVAANQVVTLTAWSGNAADTTLDGQASWQILTVGTDAELVVTDLTFADGFAAGEGGAVDSAATELVVRRCRFFDNRAVQNGGAISVDANAVGGSGWIPATTIIGCRFGGNWAGYAGGAIAFDTTTDGQLQVSHTRFTGNHSGYEGGCISAGSWGHTEVVVTDSTFTDNDAAYSGGAIEVGSWSTTATEVARCSFSSNDAGYEGGAIHVGSWDIGDVRISDSTFEDNWAGYQGGALDMGTWEAATLVVERSDFRGNFADTEGGAIELGGWAWHHDVLLDQVTLQANATNGTGGGIDCGSRPDLIEIEVVDSAITGNMGGGAHLNDHTELISSNSDWGTGAQDNGSYDVDTGANTYSGYGAAASFTCLGAGICW